MRWVTSIREQEDQEEPFETLIRKTRTHRAILNVLPEFTLQRKSDFERTLKIIFSLETRWTYLEYESAIGILKLIPSIDIFQTFWEICEDTSMVDRATLAVELWLLSELSSSPSQNYKNLCNKIQNLLSQENTQPIALLSAFQNDLEVDLSPCNISNIKIAFENYYYKEIRKQPYERQNQFHNLVSYQTKEKQYELLLTIGNRWGWTNVYLPLINQSLEKIIFPEIEFSILSDSLRLRLLPYLCRKLDKLTALRSFSRKLDKIESLPASYLKILVQAILEPTNNDLDNEARIVENKISNKIIYPWTSEYVLGPSVSAFLSIEKWKEFKQKLSDISNNDPKWIAKSIDVNESQNLGICLFFHPDHWDLLAEENLISNKELSELISTPLKDIFSIPMIPIDIFQGLSFLTEVQTEIPLHKVIKVVINILEKEGIERVSKARGLDGLLYRRRIQSISVEEMESLLNQANNLPSLPSIWISAVLRLCINTPNLNIELLLDFWEKNEHSKLRLSLIYEEDTSTSWNQLIQRLLDNNRASALRLGIMIAANSKLNKKVQDSLRERLLAESTNYLNGNDVSYELYCAVLLRLEPSLEEFSLWTNPDAIHRMEKSSWLLDSLSKRFISVSDPKSKLNYVQLRKQLSLFITRRCDYPATIALGALEAIIKIDENNLPALEDKMWKQSCD